MFISLQRKLIICVLVVLLVLTLSSHRIARADDKACSDDTQLMHMVDKTEQPDGDEVERLYQVLKEAVDIISRRALIPVDEEDLLMSAIEGIIESLDDPYAEFIDAEQLRQMMERFEGERYSGVGMQIGETPEGGGRIIQVFPDSPAYEAGLKRGDIITHVDGECVRERSISAISQMIRGPEDTEVSVVVQRDGEELDAVTMVRTPIAQPTVSRRMLDVQGHKLGYISISQFGENTPDEVARALRELDSADGILLDVRNNPGGMLHSSLQAAEHFAPAGPLLEARGREGTISEYTSDTEGVDVPLVVLMNSYSASGAEIMAGILRDRCEAVLVGSDTFGKGKVQSIFKLDDAGLRITTAEYVLPSGYRIDDIGLHPDIYIRRSGRATAAWDRWTLPEEGIRPGDSGEDVLLLKLRLQQLGYYDNCLDEHYDARTRRAVALFQRAHKLPVTGIADETTVDNLMDCDRLEVLAESPDFDFDKLREDQPDLRLDQQQLRALGVLWQLIGYDTEQLDRAS